MQATTVAAAGEEARERVMLFNTRGLAVSTVAAAAAGAGLLLRVSGDWISLRSSTRCSRRREVDAGVLLELICDFKQAKYLAGWFRKRGYGLRVAGGEACEGRKGVRNSVAVFYRLRKFKEARGDVVGKYKRCNADNRAGAATKLCERVLRVCLQRTDRSVLNLVAWHGCHDEARFAAQLETLRDVAESGCAAMVLGDVNRRLSVSHASRASALGAGDRAVGGVRWLERSWRAATRPAAAVWSRMIPMLDESEAAATRRAVVGGAVQWSILDRGVETGGERGRWQLDEIVLPEAGGAERSEVSDHAAVCFERIAVRRGDGGDPKPKIPGVRKWSADAAQAVRAAHQGLGGEGSGDVRGERGGVRRHDGRRDARRRRSSSTLKRRREQGRRWRSDHDNCSIRERWRWRLRRLLDMRACKGAVRRADVDLAPEVRAEARRQMLRRGRPRGRALVGGAGAALSTGAGVLHATCAAKTPPGRSSSCSAWRRPSRRRTRWRGRSWRSR